MEFNLPLKKDDLLREVDGCYWVKTVVPLRDLNKVFDSKYFINLLRHKKLKFFFK